MAELESWDEAQGLKGRCEDGEVIAQGLPVGWPAQVKRLKALCQPKGVVVKEASTLRGALLIH